MLKRRHILGFSLALIALQADAAEVLLTMESYGPIRVGMDVGRVHGELKKMGRKNLPDPSAVAAIGCDYYNPSSKLSFMTNDRRIVRIETREVNVATPSGLRVGVATSKAKSLFGSRIEDTQQFYSGDSKDRTLIVVSQDGKHAMRFEVDERINEMYAGYTHSIRYVEGCS